jgi:hypothetical protein
MQCQSALSDFPRHTREHLVNKYLSSGNLCGIVEGTTHNEMRCQSALSDYDSGNLCNIIENSSKVT